MSHYLLSRKCWLGLILLPCVFFGIVYIGLDYVEQRITQLETLVTKVEGQLMDEEKQLALQEVMIQSEEALNESEIDKKELQYPCKLKMKHERIGLYVNDEYCIKEFKQVGEYLETRDVLELRRGIEVINEQELVMLLESFHLQ